MLDLAMSVDCTATAIPVSLVDVGLSSAIHSPTTVPNLYAGKAAGGEQPICTDLCLAVGLAIDHLEFCDMVGAI